MFSRMTARVRFVTRLVTMLLALAGLVTVGALPAAAQSNSGTVPYVALGDSYAAGQGGGDYLNRCLESPNGYPYLLDHRRRIDLRDNLACTGATTSTVASTQLPVLKALGEETELVTLTVGAADLGLSQILAACTAGTEADCLLAINTAKLQLPALGVNLTNLYVEVAKAAPNALIVVTGYPYLFEVDQPLDCDDLSTLDIMEQVNCATVALNATIQQAVAAARAMGYNVIYVDVTDDFAGHGIGSEEPYINSEGPDAYHPNAAGYRVYSKAIFAAWKDYTKQSAA